MKVAFNALAATRGGAVTQLRPLLSELHARRPSWSLVVYVSEPNVMPGTPGVEVEHLVVSSGWRRARLEWFELERTAAQNGADCIVNLLNSGSLWPKLPTITWQRNALYFDRTWLRTRGLRDRMEALLRRTAALMTCRASDLTLVPSETMRNMVVERVLARGVQVEVLPHGVDLHRFSFEPKPRSTSIVIGVMGHPAAHRGIDDAVEALADVVASGVDATLRFTMDRVGNPAFQDTVDRAASIAARLGIEDRITFAGPAADPARWYHETDMLLVPSRCESFAFPVIEAFACGTAVATSGIPTLREVGGAAAVHATGGSGKELADAIRRSLAGSDSEMAPQRDRGYVIAREHSWMLVAERLAARIEEVVAIHHPDAAAMAGEQ